MNLHHHLRDVQRGFSAAPVFVKPYLLPLLSLLELIVAEIQTLKEKDHGEA